MCPFNVFVPHLSKSAWEIGPSDKQPFLSGAQRPKCEKGKLAQQWAVTPWGGPICHHPQRWSKCSHNLCPKGWQAGEWKTRHSGYGPEVLFESLALENCAFLGKAEWPRSIRPATWCVPMSSSWSDGHCSIVCVGLQSRAWLFGPQCRWHS